MGKLKITFDREPVKAAFEFSSVYLLFFPIYETKNAQNEYGQQMYLLLPE